MNQTRLLSEIVTGLVTLGASTQLRANEANATGTDAGGGKTIECQGANACKGKGECGGPGYSCAGNNQCRSKGWVTAKSEKECEELKAKIKAADGKAGKKAKGKA